MASIPSTHLKCLCGTVAAPGSLLSDSVLPASAEICHCNTCRRISGSLGLSFLRINSSPPAETLSVLIAYPSSSLQTRYFCSRCGCHCFHHDHEEEKWYCLSGIIEPASIATDRGSGWPKDIVHVTSHEYVLETIDGGLTPLLLSLNGKTVRTWTTAARNGYEYDLPHETVFALPRRSMHSLSRPEVESFIRAKCHCEGVSIIIKRAEYPARAASGASSRFIPSDPAKYLTYLCACRSCRLSTGTSLMPFALVPTSNVFNGKASGIEDKLVSIIFGKAASEPGSNPGLSLKHNWSSPNVCRTFCGRCGATVFYWNAERPDELDVAVGILRSEEGSMCRRWLEWDWGRCSFPDECTDQELCEAWLKCAETMRSLDSEA